MLTPLLLLAIADPPTPAAQPAPPPQPAAITLPADAPDTPEIIPPFGDSPAAHIQARTASKIVLETAREASAEPDTADDAEAGEQATKTPSSSSG